MYTTDPGGYTDEDKTWDSNGSKIFGNGQNGTYKSGKQLSSPLYIGLKTKHGIKRMGYNFSGSGDFIQNGFHHLKLPFVVWGLPAMNSGHFQTGNYNSFYYQSGTYTPGILY